MDYVSAQLTHLGLQRDDNEDAVLADDEKGIWLVADGMGGHAGGEVASRLAVETVYRCVCGGMAISDAITEAHLTILTKAQAEPDLDGMGTTIVVAVRRGRKLQLAWVGDSRIYCLNGKGFSQLSVDHSFVQDMIARGVLTREEAEVHPQKNLVRQALGQAANKRLQVDCRIISLQPGEQILLCTDGVHDMLDAGAIGEALSTSVLAQRLPALERAVLATEASDNFSAVLLERRPPNLVKNLNEFFGAVFKSGQKAESAKQ